MALDPLKTSDEIKKAYIQYLTTTFRFQDEDLNRELKELLEFSERLIKGPIIEAIPPFETGGSLRDFIQEGILSKEFEKLMSDSMPLERKLYKHQELAVKKVIREERNLIVSTGTGSGKTETYLIPILNSLMKEKEKGILNPGVRALLLFPMNALANDQMKRLKIILKNYPDITFGSYTGETDQNYNDALDYYHKINKNEEPLVNEIISRDQMQRTPPHILLTNYAMLEYLLLRPKDNVFFDGRYAQNWRFIVIDEVHTYRGAKGIEMSMLLRRLKQRILAQNIHRLYYIATSATLVGGEEDFKQIANFAALLFGEPNSFHVDDIILAERKDLLTATGIWEPENKKFYIELEKAIDDNQNNNNQQIKEKISQIFKNHNVPEYILKNMKEKESWKQQLYSLLSIDKNIHKLQMKLSEGPDYLDRICTDLFPEEIDIQKILISLINIANKACKSEHSLPIIPARYHYFVRATDGLFISFKEKKRLFTERRNRYKLSNGEECVVFEIALCRRCGSIYLVGNINDVNKKLELISDINPYEKNPRFFLIANEYLEYENEDENFGYSYNSKKLENYILCIHCGSIKKENLIENLCNCGKENYLKIIQVPQTESCVHKCYHCGNVITNGSIVQRFLFGEDAVASVLATALYQNLPEPIKEKKNIEINTDGWSYPNPEDALLEENSPTKRRLLIFSDSRQDAAYFAPYLELSYKQIIQRRFIVHILQKYKEEAKENKWTIKDLALFLKQNVQKYGFYSDLSWQEVEQETWKWVLCDFLNWDRTNSLESLAIVGYKLSNLPKVPPKIKDTLGLDDEEGRTLIQVLLDSFRKYGSVTLPHCIVPTDEDFRGRPLGKSFRLISKNSYGWIPSSGHQNSRTDYIYKLLKLKHEDIDYREANLFLEEFWNKYLTNGEMPLIKNKIIIAQNEKNEIGYYVNYEKWKIISEIINDDVQWYRCSVCGHWTINNIKDVCPTFRCMGKLSKADPSIYFKQDHYYQLYHNLSLLNLNTTEHTAQLSRKAAAEKQKEFYSGNINVLSCSTTFELGVDLGELEAVFMRNIPPTASNYIQRAGRAGRRTDTTAYVLTFARRRSHDFTYFQNPEKIVIGEIRSPYFKIENEKIINRHIYATALASFWKENPEYFEKVEDFFFKKNANEITGYQLFKDFLLSHPPALQIALKTIFPAEIESKQLVMIKKRIDNWEWVNQLLGDDNGILEKTKNRLYADVNHLEKAYSENIEKKFLEKARKIDQVIKAIKDKYLITFLSQNNVIPKYGFPVDVVSLYIEHHCEEAKNLELDRDLSIALSEYAPESEVVAGGYIWTSRYIKKPIEKSWQTYKFYKCPNCGYFQKALSIDEDDFLNCKSCNYKITNHRYFGTYLVPEFGFVAEYQSKKPTMQKPQKTYTTRKYYTPGGISNGEQKKGYNFNGQKIDLIFADGDLTVLNRGHNNLDFWVCEDCGYSVVNESGKPPEKHESSWFSNVIHRGSMQKHALGYSFKTDILRICIEESIMNEEFWLSLLYAILEGISKEMMIDREDIDGCLYYFGYENNPEIIIFDDFPGGAGHVKRIFEQNNFESILRSTLNILLKCNCGGEEGDSSCYGCLRNYSNQFCHDKLKRNLPINFIKKILGENQ